MKLELILVDVEHLAIIRVTDLRRRDRRRSRKAGLVSVPFEGVR